MGTLWSEMHRWAKRNNVSVPEQQQDDKKPKCKEKKRKRAASSDEKFSMRELEEMMGMRSRGYERVRGSIRQK